jgi:CHAD domain-containing protein
MRKYARERTSTLLRRLVFRLNHAARSRDPDSIHDLRVSIRRLQQCLSVFRQFFPSGAVKRIHRRLHKLMALSGEIRNRDVALDLLKEAGTPAGSELSARWIEEKKQFQSDLSRLLRRWPKRGLSRKWSSRLGLR